MNQIALLLALTTAAPPAVEWSRRGGKSPFAVAEVAVADGGAVTVRFQRHGQPAASSTFALDADEWAAVQADVRIADGGTAGVAVPAPDLPVSALTVRLDGRTRAVHNPVAAEFEPLTRTLDRLIHQAVVTVDLETRGDLFQAANACSPRAAAEKAYEPRLLVAPLKAAIAKADDRQKLAWGLEGVAWLLTEEQWLGYWADQFRQAAPARRTEWLAVAVSHPFSGNVPPGHARVLVPLLTSELAAGFGKPLDAATDGALASACWFVGERADAHVTVVLTQWAQTPAASSTKTAAAAVLEGNRQRREKADRLAKADPAAVIERMEGFRKALPEPQGLNEMNGTGVADIDGNVHPDSHLTGVATRLGVASRAEAAVLLTYLNDRDPKLRRIAAFALERLVRAYPHGMSSDDLQNLDSAGHRKLIVAYAAGVAAMEP